MLAVALARNLFGFYPLVRSIRAISVTNPSPLENNTDDRD